MEERKDELFLEEANVDTDCVKCASCGSNMTFDPETQMLKCGYCDYTVDFSKDANLREIDINSALENNATWNDDTRAYRCDNCGAKIVVEKTQTAGLCPFCGTSHVIAEEDLQGIRPNGVVPFIFSKEKATGLFRDWARKKLFAPRDFKNGVKADKMNGVYMPFFTFDSDTSSVYEGKVGYRRTRTVRTKNGVRTETYIVWKNIRGSFAHFFDDILINAGERLDGKKMKKLSPFDFSVAKVYENEFLSGFSAHRYERDIRTCWEDAKKEIDAKLRSMIIAQYNCDQVSYLNVSTKHSGVTFKYVMLPVYVINYTYKKKNYVIYQNGSTGKIVGKSPKSWWKVLIACLLGAAAVAGIAALIYFFYI